MLTFRQTALAVIIAALFIFNTYYHGGYAVDDAFIGFRYVDNLLHGHGLVFNTGEKIEGYTNFFWLVLLTPLIYIGIAPETAALILNFLCLVLIFLAVSRSAVHLSGNNSRAGWMALILIAGFGSFAFWFTSGMETLCVTALVALANWKIIKEKQVTTSAAVLFGLATLTRPDSGLYAVPAFLFLLPLWPANKHISWRRYLENGLIYALFPLLHTLFRWAYYGDPLPNTFYAKMHPDAYLIWRFGVAYTYRFEIAGGIVLTVLPVLGLLLKAYRSYLLIAGMIAAQIALFIFYSMKVGGDYMLFFRFYITVAVLMSVLSAVALNRIVEFLPKPEFYAHLLATALAFAMTILLLKSSEMDQSSGVRAAMRDNEILSKWIINNFPPDTLLAMNNVGIVPYRTRMPVIDMLGLNDRHIARAKVALPRVETGTYIGHFKYDGNYVCERQPRIMIPTTTSLRYADSQEQALWLALRASFDSDREFLRNPRCAAEYQPFVQELLPHKYIVFYIRRES